MKRALAIGFWLSLVYAGASGCGLNPKPDLPSGDNASGVPTGAAGGAGGSAGGIFGEGGAIGGGGFPASGSGGFSSGFGGSTGNGATTSFLDAGASVPGEGVKDAGPDAGHDARPDPLHDGPDARP